MTTNTLKRFGNIVSTRRRVLGISRRKLRKSTGISISGQHGIERGANCTLKTAQKLCTKLGIIFTITP